MNNIFILGALIFIVAVSMTMVGKGGGNFYVVILALATVPMHQAAATGQFILFSASIAALFIFQKNNSVSWSLAVIIGTLTALSALAGGYLSHLFNDFVLKMIFAGLLIISGMVMLLPPPKAKISRDRFGVLKLHSKNESFTINLWIAVPITVLTGFASGMVGVSGGSFLVPLMVVACGVSMKIAVGTASTLIAVTSLMGFIGHATQGDFNPKIAVPLAIVTIVGGIIGGKLALKSKPKNLKKLFAYTNWIAAIFMIANAMTV